MSDSIAPNFQSILRRPRVHLPVVVFGRLRSSLLRLRRGHRA
jgi:hypothetical protein